MSSLVQRCLPFVTRLGLVQPIRSQTVVPVSSELPLPMGLRSTGNLRGKRSPPNPDSGLESGLSTELLAQICVATSLDL